MIHNIYKNWTHRIHRFWDIADLVFSHSYFSCQNFQESDHVSITKVVVLFTTSPTKLILHFSVFSTISYAFYKFLQIEYTIEDVTLRWGPRKDLGPRSWVPRPTGRRARRDSGGSGGAPGWVRGRGGLRAHLGPCGGRRLGGGVTGVGARWWPAVATAAGGATGERAHIQDKVLHG
jgi:hypothetical protein